MSKRPAEREGRTLLHFFAKTPKLIDQSADKSNEKLNKSGYAASEPSQEPTCEPQPSSSSSADADKKFEHKFQKGWLDKFKWLSYDQNKNLMFCDLCKKHGRHNTLVTGCSNYRTSTLSRHASGTDHQSCIQSVPLKNTLQDQTKKIIDTKEKAVINCMKTVYYLVKEDLPLSKYESLVSFLNDLEVPDMDKITVDKHTSYSSTTTANGMLSSIASVISSDIKSKLEKSPVVSILADESCDIANQKKLVVYARVIDPNTFAPSTIFLQNVKVSDGSGATVSRAILECLNELNIPISKVYGFGSDGAKVMTGVKEGVTGHLLRQQPMLLNFHCVAHRLALVSSQAAAEIPYLKEYQETLTSLFYFFKWSANRCEKLKNIQQLLEEDEIKIKEVHDVRWMSIYKAVETVYRSLDSLITLFSTDKEPKAKGFAKKVASQEFISTTYLLMDILPVITELCLVFQKRELDVTIVETNINHCKNKLQRLKEKSEDSTQPHCYLDTLDENLKLEKGKLIFKGNHVISKSNRVIHTLRNQFIDKLLDKLDQRFPPQDSEILFAMGALGMRPLTFLSKKELLEWGNQKIETLIEHFGKEKEHKYGDTVTKKEPLIDADCTRNEWEKLKQQVVNAGYPRDKLSVLWGLINEHHHDEYPNLLKLAAVAITAPIHTCDCERGFSVQNIIKTCKRNRLTPDRMNELMLVSAEGPPREQFDFMAALTHWRKEQHRRIFKQ